MHHILKAMTAVGLTTLALAGASFGQPATEKSLQLEAKIPLGNVAGRIDHMTIDLEKHRLFVAELGNDSVGVVDLNAKKVVHRISGLKEPQGVAYIRLNDSLYVANGGDGSVRVFHGPNYSPVGRIELGADADNIRADLPANRILVGFGSGAIAAIDLRDNANTKTFALKAHPESFQLDAASGQIFVNVPNARTIASWMQTPAKRRTLGRCGMAGISLWLSIWNTSACSLLSEILQSWLRLTGKSADWSVNLISVETQTTCSWIESSIAFT